MSYQQKISKDRKILKPLFVTTVAPVLF